jgi:sulfite reductase beta subunit-like hemoprotein
MARIEDVKAAGIAVDIDRLAATGFASISDDDRYRLKTQGVCAQRQVGVFMIRIRVPGGKATPRHLRRVAELAEAYGHQSLHVTSRGGLELHHVRIEDVPAVREALAEVGLTTKGTCGDTLRNVIACEHGGRFAEEVLPLDLFVRRLHDHIVAISDDTNLSRKMNVAIACSPACDAHVATSDIGFVATPDPAGGLPTFTVWGAGGLGATPRLAIELRRGLAQHDLLAAFDAIVAISVKYGDRSARAKAKIKLLVDAWGADRVRAVFDEEFTAAKQRYDAAAQPTVAAAATVPLPGRHTVDALVPMGELPADAARALANLAEDFGDGVVLLTPEQNAAVPGVRTADVPVAIAAIEAAGLRTQGRGGISDVLSCVGLEYCPIAVTHAMTMGEELALALAPRRADPRYADFRIHVSGCPHSCAKHQVADIGLSGGLADAGGRKVHAYALHVGGNARERRLGTLFPKRIPHDDVLTAIHALLAIYEAHALPGERFSATFARVGSAPFFEAVAAANDQRVLSATG